jgi:hypothetical protein
MSTIETRLTDVSRRGAAGQAREKGPREPALRPSSREAKRARAIRELVRKKYRIVARGEYVRWEDALDQTRAR